MIYWFSFVGIKSSVRRAYMMKWKALS